MGTLPLISQALGRPPQYLKLSSPPHSSADAAPEKAGRRRLFGRAQPSQINKHPKLKPFAQLCVGNKRSNRTAAQRGPDSLGFMDAGCDQNYLTEAAHGIEGDVQQTIGEVAVHGRSAVTKERKVHHARGARIPKGLDFAGREYRVTGKTGLAVHRGAAHQRRVDPLPNLPHRPEGPALKEAPGHLRTVVHQGRIYQKGPPAQLVGKSFRDAVGVDAGFDGSHGTQGRHHVRRGNADGLEFFDRGFQGFAPAYPDGAPGGKASRQKLFQNTGSRRAALGNAALIKAVFALDPGFEFAEAFLVGRDGDAHNAGLPGACQSPAHRRGADAEAFGNLMLREPLKIVEPRDFMFVFPISRVFDVDPPQRRVLLWYQKRLSLCEIFFTIRFRVLEMPVHRGIPRPDPAS